MCQKSIGCLVYTPNALVVKHLALSTGLHFLRWCKHHSRCKDEGGNDQHCHRQDQTLNLRCLS